MNFGFGRKLGFVLVVIAVFVLVVPASAQDNTMMNTLTVSGSGTAYGKPDIAYIELGVNSTDADLSTAFSQTGQSISALLDALHGLGIADEDIQTSGINVYPQDQYDPQGNVTNQRTYTVSNTVEVTVRDVEKVESVLTTAVNAGVNTINGLSFGIQDTDALEQQARADAVANARSRAEQLASALGVTLGKPVIVSEVSNSVIPLALPQTGGGPRLMAANTSQPVSQGQLSVTVNVQVTYSIS